MKIRILLNFLQMFCMTEKRGRRYCLMTRYGFYKEKKSSKRKKNLMSRDIEGGGRGLGGL
jgi:hypothetical protein